MDMEEAKNRVLQESINDIIPRLRPYLSPELPEVEEVYLRATVRCALQRYRALVITYLREASGNQNFHEGYYL